MRYLLKVNFLCQGFQFQLKETGMNMELHFLGTGSAYPSPKRSSSCIAFRHHKGIWLFDCGEGSQIQIQKSSLKPGQIRKIFITHLHGDHLFGLPGLLCTIGLNNSLTEQQRVDIYGPVGLRNFVRSSLTLSYSNLPFTYSVHEMMLPSYQDFYSTQLVHSDHGFREKLPDISRIQLPLHPNEIAGTEICPDEKGCYSIFSDDLFTVSAGTLQHSIPCLGYVVQENDLPGKLDVSILKGLGVPAGPLFGKLKSGEKVHLDDGRVVTPEECVGPSRKGRKIVIFGDTCNSERMRQMAIDPDVLVHEATNENADEEKSISHGHSSAGMAGSFACSINAKKLVITHFSQRYKGIQEDIKDGSQTVEVLLEEAKQTFGNKNVVAADDLYVLTIPAPK